MKTEQEYEMLACVCQCGKLCSTKVEGWRVSHKPCGLAPVRLLVRKMQATKED